MRLVLAFLVCVAVATAARAGAVITVTSDVKARVVLGGEDYGPVAPGSPLIIRDLGPGKYEVKVESIETGEVQIFTVRSPKAGTVERTVQAFTRAAQVPPEAPVAGPPPAEPPPMEPPVANPPPPPTPEEIAAREAEAKKAAQKAATTRNRNRTRNVLLGGALLNEVANKGKSKSSLRTAVVGLGLLNEVANR